MALTVTEEERRALEAAQAKSRAVRHWRRYQAVLLRADGLAGAEVARVLRGTETSGCNWTPAWRAGGGRGGAGGGAPVGRVPATAGGMGATRPTASRRTLRTQHPPRGPWGAECGHR